MKKFMLFTAIVLMIQSLSGQINIIDTSFYSESLQQTKMVDVFLPTGYDDNPDLYYPVIYYLHGWLGNQNSGNTAMSAAYSLINQGQIDPVIVVCADNNAVPFDGSMYVNSTLWGNYETFMVVELPDWIENTYRAMPDRNYRGLFGQSMGGYGAFRYGILHKEKYRAIASHAGIINILDEFAKTQWRQMILQENQPGPPYFYDYYNSGFFTKGYFLLGGAFSPNNNTPQTYINPQIVEFCLNENGDFIDTVLTKVEPHDIAHILNQISPSDSLGIYFGCGSNDELFLYPGHLAVKDTLDLLGIPYKFFLHNGGHTMPYEFRVNSLLFLDSLLMPPVVLPSSCLPEGITFTTQQEINNFQINHPGCTEIEGDVIIEGNTIWNLNGLSILTAVYGNLSIGDYLGNPSLTDISGLSNLITVGGTLKIWRNSNLANLFAMQNVTFVGGDLIIYVNDGLFDLSGLDNLNAVGGTISIMFNAGLQNIVALSNVASMGGGDLLIRYNNSLTDLEGLENLTEVTGYVDFSGNGSMTSLQGLNNLTTIGSYLEVSHTALTSLAGLSNLTTIGGGLIIEYNDLLYNLVGLDDIVAGSITDLKIVGNDNLTFCEIQSLCEYLSDPNGMVEIYGNAPGCNSPSDVAAHCGFTMDCLPYGNYYFFSQQDIDEFAVQYPGCSVLTGEVVIGGYDITNLEGLSIVTSIAGNLTISSNTLLSSLSGLDNLSEITGNLDINESAILSLEGFENLTAINGNMVISYTSLLSLDGLENLTHIGGSLTLTSNDDLEQIAALGNLTSISGKLTIGGLMGGGNMSLTSLSGLDNIDAGTISELMILGNLSLSSCEVQSICDYLAAPGAVIVIGANAPGCNSIQEVEDACTVSVPENIPVNEISIYPNPAGHEFYIVGMSSVIVMEVNIYKLSGLKVLQTKQTNGPVDISSLHSGTYIVEMVTEQSNTRARLMIVK
nr:T9SS type A sorting domain-containing protein [Bacteroidota bacterium]